MGYVDQLEPRLFPWADDHILISGRWVSAVKSCMVRWGALLKQWGGPTKVDHGALVARLHVQLKAVKLPQAYDASLLQQPSG